MATYKDKNQLTDKGNKSISQKWNERLQDFTPNRTAVNSELEAEATIAWDGVKTTDSVAVALHDADAVLVAVDNSGSTFSLVAALELEVASGDWRLMQFANGQEAVYPIAAGAKRAIGPIAEFPRYLGGRVRVYGYAAPTGATKVQVQEVR